jgi:dolichyl-phosphate beta-glucosyltransferase
VVAPRSHGPKLRGAMRKVGLTVPCYQEARRFDPEGFAELATRPDVTLLLVDDGSTDDTIECLRAFAARPGVDAEVLRFARNRGKAEVVRDGMRSALAAGAEVVGYVDADLATPPAEVGRLLEALAAPGLAVVLGSRVQVLGSHIARAPLHHYGARVFASWFSLILRAPVYDTQCGAKLFRRTPALEAALVEPFLSRWCFDVELLGRLLIGTPEVSGLPLAAFREVPLCVWRDVPGSKFSRLRGAPRLCWESLRIAIDLAVRRRRLRS